MNWPEFAGHAYRLESPNASPAETYNFYLEVIEKGPRAGQLRLRQIPGLKNYLALGAGPIRNLWAGVNRNFAISAGELFEIFEDPATPPTDYGNVGNSAEPAIVVSNGFELAIASAGQLYITTGGPAFPVSDTSGQPILANSVAFLDQYFIAGIVDSKQVRISNLAPDGAIWDAGDVAIKEAYADNIVRVWVDQPGGELLWLFGNDTYEVWQDTGDSFPFQRIQGAAYPIGCDSPYSVAGALGKRFWLWRGIIWMAQGLEPQRISDYGVEQIIKKLSHYDQEHAEAFCYVDGGHLFYCINFPESGIGFTLDAGTGNVGWHRRQFWNNNQWQRYRPRVCATQWAKNYVGDYSSGKIFIMDPDTFTDADGVFLRRDRIAHYITDELNNLTYSRLTIDMDTGVGLSVASDQPGWDPAISMRYSADRGKTWSNWRTTSVGKIGETMRRVVFTQLGSSYIGLTVQISMTAPVGASINGADIVVGAGTMGK